MKRGCLVEVEVLRPIPIHGRTDDLQSLFRHRIEEIIALVVKDVEQSALCTGFEFKIPLAAESPGARVGRCAGVLVRKPFCQESIITDAKGHKAFPDPIPRPFAKREQQTVSQKIRGHAADRVVTRTDPYTGTKREINSVVVPWLRQMVGDIRGRFPAADHNNGRVTNTFGVFFNGDRRRNKRRALIRKTGA